MTPGDILASLLPNAPDKSSWDQFDTDFESLRDSQGSVRRAMEVEQKYLTAITEFVQKHGSHGNPSKPMEAVLYRHNWKFHVAIDADGKAQLYMRDLNTSKCPLCRVEVVNGQRFCGSCGVKLETSAILPMEAQRSAA
jgi:hypothetical protein